VSSAWDRSPLGELSWVLVAAEQGRQLYPQLSSRGQFDDGSFGSLRDGLAAALDLGASTGLAAVIEGSRRAVACAAQAEPSILSGLPGPYWEHVMP